MAIFKCKMCGGALEINNQTVATCEYCGTQQTLPKLDDEKKIQMYDRANHFRRNNEFDKAMEIYEQILNEDNTDAESYWSLVLCRYGIEYVEDPSSHKRIPTVNRAQFTSIYDDDNYKSALQYADSLQKTVYEEEAKTINEIQKGILEISQKEEPFDVFICYKETEANGRRTPDSVLANDLYHQLTQEGFKVFFARITLEDKLGSAYEPYIFAALNSSKVMVVLGTKPEYFNAVWVKNEWSRYLALIKNGEKKMLIPAYKDMDPYELPEEFSHLQAQDMSKLGFMQDLIRGIKKITATDEPKQTVVKETVVTNTATEPLLKRAFMFLEDGDFTSAEEYCEKVLDIDPENGQAYLGKLMTEIRVKKLDECNTCGYPLDNIKNYQKAIRFLDEKTKVLLNKYNNEIKKELLQKIYFLLQEGDFAKADECCERFINASSECAQVYLYKFLAQFKLNSIEDVEKVNLGGQALLIDAGPEKIKAIKIIRDATGIDLQTAKDTVINVPSYLDLKDSTLLQLREIGATVISAAENALNNVDNIISDQYLKKFLVLGEKQEVENVKKHIDRLEEDVKQKRKEMYEKEYDEFVKSLHIDDVNTINFCENILKTLLRFKGLTEADKLIQIIENKREELKRTKEIQTEEETEICINLIERLFNLNEKGSLEKQTKKILFNIGELKKEKKEKVKILTEYNKTTEKLVALNHDVEIVERKITTLQQEKNSLGILEFKRKLEINKELSQMEVKLSTIKREKLLEEQRRAEFTNIDKTDKEINEVEKIIIEKQQQYDELERLTVEKNNIIEELKQYRLVTKIRAQYQIYNRAQVKDNKFIIFGKYWQDEDSNSKQEIEWIILDKLGSKLLVISKYAIDSQLYNTEYPANTTWETCSLREWLNNEFINNAFTEEEKTLIPTVEVKEQENSENNTQDKIFLLSVSEINKYLNSNESRQCKPTAYAVNNGATVNSNNGNCLWWLRSHGYTNDSAVDVLSDGKLRTHGCICALPGNAVRPALWISLE